MENGRGVLTLKEIDARLETVEEQMQHLLEKQQATEILLLKIDGGMTAIKWVAAVIGFLFGVGEC